MLLRPDRLKKFCFPPYARRSAEEGAWKPCVCRFDRLKKLRCVRTVGTPNFVLTRRTYEAAASRRTLRVLQDSRRVVSHGIARAAVQAMLVFAVRQERRRSPPPAPGKARFERSAPVEFSRQTKGVHVAAHLPSQADKGRRALARRRSRLRAAPTARPRHVGCHFAPAASRWSRQPPRRCWKAGVVAAFAA
jgi:hypothetical protein